MRGSPSWPALSPEMPRPGGARVHQISIPRVQSGMQDTLPRWAEPSRPHSGALVRFARTGALNDPSEALKSFSDGYITCPNFVNVPLRSRKTRRNLVKETIGRSLEMFSNGRMSPWEAPALQAEYGGSRPFARSIPVIPNLAMRQERCARTRIPPCDFLGRGWPQTALLRPLADV
jgi:hypothetical protein